MEIVSCSFPYWDRITGGLRIRAYVLGAVWEDVAVAEDDEPLHQGNVDCHCVRTLSERSMCSEEARK